MALLFAHMMPPMISLGPSLVRVFAMTKATMAAGVLGGND